MNESYDTRRQRWNDWRNLPPPSKPDFAATDLSLYELCTLLKDDEGFIPMPSYYILEELVKEYGSDNIVKVIQDIEKKLDGRES